MDGQNQEALLSKLRAALQTLQDLNVCFRGPFVTPRKNRVYVIEGCLLTESEIVVLHEGGHFSAERVREVISGLKQRQMTTPREPKPMSEPDPQKRRRSQRVMLQVSVFIRAESPKGKRIQTQAFTVSVNAHGGLLESSYRMAAGQRITLVNPQTGEEVGCRVVRVERSSEECFATAFEFDERSPRFWPITFPPVDWGVTEELVEGSR